METDTHAAGPGTGNKLRRDMGLLGLTFAVVGSIIGSGWLLGAFSAANLLVYWSGWVVIWRLLAILVFGFVLMAISLATRKAGEQRPSLDFQHTIWLWPYLIGLAIISFLGQYGGGLALIPQWIDIAIVIIFSFAIFAWAVASVMPAEHVHSTIEGDKALEMTEPAVAEV